MCAPYAPYLGVRLALSRVEQHGRGDALVRVRVRVRVRARARVRARVLTRQKVTT